MFRRRPFNQQPDDGALPPAGFEWLRGYTGHEHLDSFGLINMNARLYDPKMGRMLSVDNYVSAPGTALGYNRYTYAMNNPVMYTDPSGDIAIVDDLILGVIGGAINLVTNLDNVQSFGQGLGYFGVGFVSGALTTYITPMGSAALTGAGNAALGSYIRDGSVDAGAVLQGAATSAIMGGITMGLSGAAAPFAEKAFSGIASPVLRGALTQGAVGAGVGGIGGGVGALMSGGDFWQGVGSGAGWGAGIGLASGAYSGYTTARSMDRNPWTGKYNEHEISPLQPAQHTLPSFEEAVFGKEVNDLKPRWSPRTGNAVEINFKDGSRMDINSNRVKEFVPNKHPKAPPGSYTPLRFDIYIEGSKGLKRIPTVFERKYLYDNRYRK